MEIRLQARGRWVDILYNLGIEREFLTKRQGPCPLCGGKTRFRFDNLEGRGTWICNHCGSGDGCKLVMEYLGVSFPDAAKKIRSIIGNCKMQPVQQIDEARKLKINEERLKRIWTGRKRITPNHPAGRYLLSRGINIYPDADLYAHDGIPYFLNKEITGLFPALFARFTNPQGETCTYHIIYLTQNGGKIDFAQAKISAPKVKDMGGGCIKLFKPGESLCIAEGIETALMVNQETGHPVWPTLTANLLEQVVIPAEVKKVYIYADSDKSFTGQAKAYALANRLSIKDGKDVAVVQLVRHPESSEVVDIFDYGLDMDYLDYETEHMVKDKAVA